MNIFHYSFLSFEASSSSSLPTLLGFFINTVYRPKWIFSVIHFCLLKIINLFWPLRILISYSLQNTKYVYSSHKPVSATLGSYPSFWERTRGLRLKPFFKPETLHYITGKYIAIFVRTHIVQWIRCTISFTREYVLPLKQVKPFPIDGSTSVDLG